MNTQTTHILLIEDNPGDIRLIAEFLKDVNNFPFELHSEKRLSAGLDYLAKGTTDVVLLDLSLPDSQGFDTFTKTIACAPQTPIVLLTVLADDAVAIKALQAGAQDYLNKGQVSGDLLVRTIRYSIERKQADETLQKSEKRFRALVEHSLEEISLVDSDGTLTYESPTSRRPLGYPPNSLVGYDIIDLFHPDDRATAAKLLEQVVKHPGSVKEALFRLRHQDGSWRWMEGSLTNLLDEPAVQSVVINYRDITESKQANLVRQALFEIMQGSVETEDLQGFLILVHKSISKVIYAENFFVALYNKDTALFEEVYSVDKYDPPTHPKKMKKSISAYVFRTGKPLLLTQTRFDQLAAQGEVELVGKNSPSWLGIPLIISNETIGVMVVQDYEKDNRYSERDLDFLVSITGEVAQVVKRKRAEEKILQSDAELKAAQSVAHVGSWRWDIKNNKRTWSDEMYRIFGVSKEIFTGVLADVMAQAIHPEDRPAVKAAELSLMHNKKSIPLEYRIIWPDKSIHVVWAEAGEPILDEKGNPSLLTGIVLDITKHKRAEKDIENLAKFPSENPNPVLRIARDDTLLYINEAGLNLLPEWHLQIGKAVPTILRETLTQSMNDGKTQLLDLKHGERVYSFFITPIVSAGYTNLYGRDITDIRQAEKEMRRLINDLRNLSEVEKKNRLFAEALAKNVIFIKSTLNTDEILDSIIDNINNVVPADAINIMLIEGEHARVVRSSGYQERGLTDWIKQRQFDLDEIKTSREIIRSKKYKIISNTDKSKDWTVIAETAWIKSNIIAPILEDKTVIGFVNVNSTTPDFYTDEHAQQLMAFTDQVSTALNNARLFEATRQRLNRMQAMTQIDQAINSSLDLNVSLEIVVSNTKEQLGADAVDILLMNNATSSLVFSKAKGFKTDEICKSNFGLGDGLHGKSVLERTMVSIPDLKSAGESYFKNLLVAREGFISYYCVPLITKGELKGVMEVYFRNAFQADQEWLEFLGMLAQQTAIAINNAELLNSLQTSNIQLLNAYETTLKGWVDALDMRDKETEGHTQRVTELSLKLARRMGIKDKEIVHFQRGALLHDIGKVAVSDAILNKPGPLTEEEWVIMRRHPMYANQLLSKSDYLKPALDIPYCHHEKWDGSGYPRGLKGEAIPLAARIFAIVDVWDALISDRPYCKAWTKKKALEHIQEQSGKHFDPEVVKVFLKTIDDF